ncbi:oxygen-independent coproporphyrinogen III oxidase [Arvimicrobium flavum]|uniref:oxygen-independent coproporphyrinogen III oxidase n=1 Tax=Arvimicrobium flavum TaxID=3393320 RepID=UPI00237A41DA|nr:oxygen-independent coproporphyrinogen III oxidase [Mesorhizobium shangrilense]
MQRDPDDLDARLGETVPRYTSYPTAPHFHAAVTSRTVDGWLDAIPADDALSLYMHVPFCDKLCWFCACHTKQTHRYEPVTAFLTLLRTEIVALGAKLAGRGRIKALHFGGGSPTMLRPDDLHMLADTLRAHLDMAGDAAISVEIDPNDMTAEKLDAWAAIGVTRASLGIQDFNPKVQKAINREQSFELTRDVVQGLRGRGIDAINFDLLYGLPHQTEDSVGATVRQALTLAPDRIALFGYAHVPWFKKHQTMIDDAWLPDGRQRLAQSQLAARILVEGGYEAVGIDHFAKPGDSLAQAARTGRLHRNFQGYTDDSLETLIGLGPSSVSRFREGYAQNHVPMPAYQRDVVAGQLPIAKGIAFTPEDRVRSWVIERLMCDFAFSTQSITQGFGKDAEDVCREADSLARAAPDMLVRNGDRFVIPPDSRMFARSVAARFDAYRRTTKKAHSVAV